MIDSIERSFDATEFRTDIGVLEIALATGHARRFQRAAAIERLRAQQGVADRRGLLAGIGHVGFERSGSRRIGNAAERSGVRFKRRLTTQQFLEFLVELLLIKELAAGGAID